MIWIVSSLYQLLVRDPTQYRGRDGTETGTYSWSRRVSKEVVISCFSSSKDFNKVRCLSIREL